MLRVVFQNPYLSSNSDLYDFNFMFGKFLPVQIKKIDNITSHSGPGRADESIIL